jgi:Flp pilus assembly protein TadD
LPNLLATVIDLQGRHAEAAACIREALARTPGTAAIHANLAFILAEQGIEQESTAEYDEALKRDPSWAEHARAEAWTLATAPTNGTRSGALAVRLALQACQASGAHEPAYYDTLAAAYAEAGRFEDAQAAIQRALNLARVTQKPLVELQARERLYRDRQPYRAVPAATDGG